MWNIKICFPAMTKDIAAVLSRWMSFICDSTNTYSVAYTSSYSVSVFMWKQFSNVKTYEAFSFELRSHVATQKKMPSGSMTSLNMI